MRWVLALMFVVGTLSACSPDPCSAPQPNESSVELDVSGAANTACTLSVTLDGQTLTFDVAPPIPAVTDSSLGARAAAAFYSCNESDSGTPAQVTPANDITVLRSSTRMCITQSQLLDAFSHRPPDACAVTLSLTCSNVVFYKDVSWRVCNTFC